MYSNFSDEMQKMLILIYPKLFTCPPTVMHKIWQSCSMHKIVYSCAGSMYGNNLAQIPKESPNTQRRNVEKEGLRTEVTGHRGRTVLTRISVHFNWAWHGA